jgi:rubrerythrin
MDDRLELAAVAVEIHADGLEAPLRFSRQGPIWLGLVCGTLMEIASADAGE